jgi:DNA recombination protein Rad52
MSFENSRFSCGCYAVVRVSYVGGNSHEDIGYGEATNQQTEAGAFELALKGAVSDGCKRALRIFGSAVGNCLYDRNYRYQLAQGMHREEAVAPVVKPNAIFDDLIDNAIVDSAIFESDQPTPGSLSARLTPRP